MDDRVSNCGNLLRRSGRLYIMLILDQDRETVVKLPGESQELSRQICHSDTLRWAVPSQFSKTHAAVPARA